MKVAVIIVAAGRGHRVGADLPKQYLPLCGKPILQHTVAAFLKVPTINLIQTVIHANDQALYETAIGNLDLLPPVFGGDTRQQSVIRGLESLAMHEPDLVLIHDAARPFISPRHIEDIIAAAEEHGAVIPTLPVVNTVKQISGQHITGTIDRSSLARAQTPQAFRFKLIYMAHLRTAATTPLTDDCAVAEACGIRVTTVPGEDRNFKITTAGDLMKAEHMMKQQLTDIRTGMGYDVHAFAPGDQVTLCGVPIPHTAKLKGHSDADVALHALTDALLGAIGEGDIGVHFPPSDDQWKGAASDIFLKHAADLLHDKGGVIANLDLTIICEAPKISPHHDAMRNHIADLLDLAPNRVSIKATTTEKLGFAGREEGIAAQAIVTVRLPE
ncbi:bifunctional 2-C-methyl-D-erythritol 4-phosphate cytidylyltransferase/2-C-methyl-D-erythritol 2,4-cyclodiphosphate synthase [Paremcibacter congregatus]|uniref:Bifunctional enzyme IspD/IspF n=1 Tax=Paremcibacter congregatus TaxID=2043170 RepID=A0A2G4YVJ6_9PROT|nr:bifunctional 2-C-methyl-D-erythritol 4-phosphate cytidylyltransferase/2-C-methyl-D-erythritol 2,4-cyclodiphosphate synthase [Paremcibacter congregatus]PHZ86349.1 bifunctional 2-C-methyl-D-erythritol 4-phosphate cytidylyltransferase/2-C-methyl-D-erythritol 2,4-cyclodiphosphate synthase [Paremcibacter congregatus]QDE27119.1 bifunctional 2-C-methyl-D-erythritol 4-phosphate cytidylyltransferase/2-C-methyl-D-erythritol 2,4-cyclodiphosphate synthase [Paremcibacter congregatus]